MHVTPPLGCPRCARTYDVPTRCIDCDGPLLDAAGREVPVVPPALSARENLAVGLGILAATLGPAAALAPFGNAALGGLLLFELLGMAAWSRLQAGRAPRDRRDPASAAALALSRRGTTSIRELIGRGGGELVAIVGEVVASPTATPRRLGLPPRFAVTDGTGVAQVDDDSLLLWAGDERGEPTARVTELDGARRAWVVGRARTERAAPGACAWHGGDGGYRDVSRVLSFDGDARRPTVAFLSRR